jgi:hypothetical protein
MALADRLDTDDQATCAMPLDQFNDAFSHAEGSAGSAP